MPGAQCGLAICVTANSAFRAGRCAYSTHCLAAPRDRGSHREERGVPASVNLASPPAAMPPAAPRSLPAGQPAAGLSLRWPESPVPPLCSVRALARRKSEHEKQQSGWFQRRRTRRCAAAPRFAAQTVPRGGGSGRRGGLRGQRHRPGCAGSAGGHAHSCVPPQRCGHGHAQPARSVELGGAACPVRNPIHGQQRSRGLR